jgi:hypothetical protein
MQTTTTGARSRLRDSSDDVETRVYTRPPPFSLDRAMVQRIMTDLAPSLRAPASAARPLVTRRPAEAPNVFLTPWAADGAPPSPWAAARAASGVQRRVRVVRRRSILPWVAFAMMFGITFGVVKDPVLRHQTAAQIQAAAATTQVAAHGSAMRLWAFVSRIRT